jgi:hypothetical protein
VKLVKETYPGIFLQQTLDSFVTTTKRMFAVCRGKSVGFVTLEFYPGFSGAATRFDLGLSQLPPRIWNSTACDQTTNPALYDGVYYYQLTDTSHEDSILVCSIRLKFTAY